MSRLIIAFCVLFTAIACDEDASTPARPDGFFDPQALEEGATELGDDFTVVPCPGAPDLQRWQWHPRLIRGQVLAPNGSLAVLQPTLWQRGLDTLIPSAHAVPLEGESVVAEAEVALYHGEKLHSETTTDALGRFCLVAPEQTSLGPEWRIEATQDDAKLRRVLLDPVDANVSVQTEALYRLISSAKPDASEHVWRNISTMSATTLDLLEPLEITPASSTQGAVEAAVDRMKRDPRITAALE